MTRARRGWRNITLGHLIIGLLLMAIWLFLSLAPMPPNDLWWHMAAGRAMVDEGRIITTNRWAYTLPPDAPYVYQSWLSEILMYGLWNIGGAPMLSLARSLAVVGSYGLLAWHSLRRSGSASATVLALLMAMLVGWSNWSLRPQTLALPIGAAFAVLLGEYLGGRARPRWLIGLPLLMLLWVNVHGSFALGGLLLGAAWAVELARALRGVEGARRRARELGAALAATGVALLFNPLGVGIFPYLRMMLGNEALQRWFVEWQAPSNAFRLSSAGFWLYVLIFLLAALMSTGPRRPSGTDLLWYVGLCWLAVAGRRYMMWHALLLMPLLAEQLAERLGRRATPASRGVVLMTGALIGGLMLATLPWFAPFGAPEPKPHIDSTTRRLIDATTPIAASEWLAQNPIDGRLWTTITYSSYTIWRLPEKPIFTDQRVELFPTERWLDYFAIADGGQRSLELLDQWQITHLLMEIDEDPALLQQLQTTPGWCERYRDEGAIIMARCP